MKPRRILVGFLTAQLLLSTASPVLCSHPPLSFSKYRLMLNSGEHLEGKGGTIMNMRLIASMSDGQVLDLPVGEISWLDYATGSKARRGALFGVASAVAVFVAARGWEPEPELNHGWAGGHTGSLVGGLILVGLGAGIGALVGSRFTQWERADLHSFGELDPYSGRVRVAVGVSF